jgi:hypothetical protein
MILVTALSLKLLRIDDFDHFKMSSLKGLQNRKFLGFSSFMTYLGYYVLKIFIKKNYQSFSSIMENSTLK